MFCTPETDWSCAFTAEKLEEMREDAATAALLDRSEILAWNTLAALCAYRIGVCPDTIRPCAARCAGGGTWMAAPVSSSEYAALPLRTIGGMFTPHITGGVWVNSCRCTSTDSCDCSALPEIILPGPVGAIESVSIGGEIIDPSAYRVENGNRLVRIDGGTWPLCPDDATPTGPPTWGPASTSSTTYVSNGMELDMTVTFTRVGDIVTLTVDGEITARPQWVDVKFVALNRPEFDSDPRAGDLGWVVDETMDWYCTVEVASGQQVSLFDWNETPPFDPAFDVGVKHWEFTYLALPTDVEPNPVTTGPFEVTYYRGAAPNEMTKFAAGLLAYEFYKACSGGKCRLPAGVTQVTRQGVTMEIQTGMFPGGFTGIREVDAVIRIYNPHGLKRAPRVLSPDGPGTPRRVTWSA